MASNKDGNINTTWDSICEALLFVMDSARYPLYIHCNQGKHRTGCVIGCLRKIAGMRIDTIIQEYEVYSGIKARPADKELIRRFEPKMVLEYAKQQGKFEDKDFLNRIEHAFNGGLDDLLSAMGSRRASDGIDSIVTEWSSQAENSSEEALVMGGKCESQAGKQDLARPVLERTMSDLTCRLWLRTLSAEELDQDPTELDGVLEDTAISVVELGDENLTPPAAYRT